MESVIENKQQRKKLFGHNRSTSLFQSFSHSKPTNTYGKKKTHNVTLSRAQADYQQWNSLKFDNDNASSSVGLGIERLIPLEIDNNNKENVSWEDETTEVLRKIRSKDDPDSKKFLPVKGLDESPSKSNRLSRLVRTISSLSTTSISSKDTIDGKNQRNFNRISQQSSVSTIQRYSIGSNHSSSDVTPIKPSIGSQRYSSLMLDAGNLRRSSVAKNLSQILNNSDIDSDEEEDDLEEEKNIPGIVVPFDNDNGHSKGGNGNSSNGLKNSRDIDHIEPKANSHVDIEQHVDQLNIPSYPISSRNSYLSLKPPPNHSSNNSSPIPSPTMSTGSGNSPLLAYKKDTMIHKKVTKETISGPRTLVNHQDYFAPRPSFDSTNESINSMYSLRGDTHSHTPSSRASRYGTSFINSITPHSSLLSLRSTKAKERTLSTSSEFVPVTNINTNTSTSTRQSKHSHKLSLVNGFTKKSSIQDMKRLISFSPSSSSLFRSSSNSTQTSTITKSPSMIGDSFDKSMISLPTPVDGSREKLRNKLRASTSLLSLARSDTSGSLTVGIPVAEYEQNQLKHLLSLCSCTEIENFSHYIDNYHNLQKLAEASFSEVFIEKSSHSSKILKIIPFGNEELDQLPVQDIIQELTIARMLMPLDGYVDILDSAVVRGVYPEHLLRLWDDYNDSNNSENYRPDFFKHDQMYCIVVMADAGTDLEHFELSSWHDAESIFWQVVNILALGEDKFDFEHRDLHWGNVVIEEVSKPISNATNLLNNLSISDDINSSLLIDEETELKVTLIDYTLSRAMTDNGNTVFTRLDHPDFFRGKGDYQFDIYRFMRTFVSNLSTFQPPNPQSSSSSSASSSSTSPTLSYTPDQNLLHNNNKQTNWSYFCPQTNVLWLHYLVDKLLNSKNLPRVTTTRSGRLSFGGGSNGSLRDAYLKGHTNNPHTSHNDEARACTNLEVVHKTLDPRKKRFGNKKHNAPMSFQDFSSAKDVLRWGVRNKYLPANISQS